MTNALKDLNTFVVEKVTTETDSTSLLLGGDYAPTEGPCQASSATGVEKVRGPEVFLQNPRTGDQGDEEIIHFSREEDETLRRWHIWKLSCFLCVP